jgi:hypothetical protein
MSRMLASDLGVPKCPLIVGFCYAENPTIEVDPVPTKGQDLSDTKPETRRKHNDRARGPLEFREKPLQFRQRKCRMRSLEGPLRHS